MLFLPLTAQPYNAVVSQGKGWNGGVTTSDDCSFALGMHPHFDYFSSRLLTWCSTRLSCSYHDDSIGENSVATGYFGNGHLIWLHW